MEENLDRKYINFDLDDGVLKSVYPKKNYKQAWSDIQNFMLKRGFEHRQYSAYMSYAPISDTAVQKLFDDMMTALPWLSEKDVIKQIDVTNEGNILSYKYYFLKEHSKTKQDIELPPL